MLPRSSSDRRAFTLVEMLVVLGIIGILIALILPAVMGAQRQARVAAIAMEIKQLETGLDTYKQQLGEYPPSFGENYGSAASRNSSMVERHLQRCYPKMTAANKNTFYSSIAPNLDQAEALVFWLGATAASVTDPFQNSQNYPHALTSTDLTRKGYYEFDQRRLAPANSSFPSFQPRNCRDTSYIYLESRTYTQHLSTSGAALGVAQPYCQDGSGTTLQTLKTINPSKFQILCAGFDGDFGQVLNNSGTSYSNIKRFPRGDNYNAADRDNITNFSDGRTLGDSRPQ